MRKLYTNALAALALASAPTAGMAFSSNRAEACLRCLNNQCVTFPDAFNSNCKVLPPPFNCAAWGSCIP